MADVNSLPNIPGTNTTGNTSSTPASSNLPGDKTPTGTGAKPQIGVAGSGNTIQIDPNNVVVTQDPTTKQWTTAYQDTNGNLQWAAVLPDSNSPTGYSVYTNQATVRQQTIQNLVSQYGSIGKVKEAFWEKGLYSASGYKVKSSLSFGNAQDSSFDAVVDNLIGTTSKNNVFNKEQNVQDVATFINGRPNYAGTRNTSTISYTSKDSAWTDLDNFYRQELGRLPSMQEFNDYYANLQQYEQQHPVKANVRTDGLGIERARTEISGPSQDDIKALMVASSSKAILAAGKDPNAISQLGGDVGSNILKLKQYAASMGVGDIYSSGRALQDAYDATEPGGSVENQYTKIQQLAAAQPKYKAYAPLFTQGYTLKELASGVNDVINQQYGTSKAVDLSNPLLMQAMTGGAGGAQMNNQQIAQLVRSQPDWASSSVAKEEASTYVNQIGKMMGFVG